jgi:hypothetical protein
MGSYKASQRKDFSESYCVPIALQSITPTSTTYPRIGSANPETEDKIRATTPNFANFWLLIKQIATS